jgi:ppGpp synthetase/RelA/SpoT-type nucleotidyltranferase
MIDGASSAEKDVSFVDEESLILAGAKEARRQYEAVRGLYSDFAASLAAVLENCLSDQRIFVHSITHRAKEPDSFEQKASRPSPDNPMSPKYAQPMSDITDKAGVRIITYFLSTVERVSEIITAQFDVHQEETRISSEPDRLGYQSRHYLVKYLPDRTTLPEYRRFAGLVAEIQVRTILQHAWAEIEHDIQYKAIATLPSRVRRRFAALAGLIEIADREFQAIEDEDRNLRAQARRNVDLGNLEEVEITGDSLRAYLNRAYGLDGRMSDFSYNWAATLLVKLGFVNFAEVDECIKGVDDDYISRVAFGSRQGQLSRFELVLLAQMGKNFILAHPWSEASADWFVPQQLELLNRLQGSGIEVGDYRPPGYPETGLRLSDLDEMGRRSVEAGFAKSDLVADPNDLPPSGESRERAE